jgi:hypothetical protein
MMNAHANFASYLLLTARCWRWRSPAPASAAIYGSRVVHSALHTHSLPTYEGAAGWRGGPSGADCGRKDGAHVRGRVRAHAVVSHVSSRPCTKLRGRVRCIEHRGQEFTSRKVLHAMANSGV